MTSLMRQLNRLQILPAVTNDIGLSVSEAYSRLKHVSKAKWTEQFRSRAEERHWLDTNTAEPNVPVLPHSLYPLFYRFRTKSFKSDYMQQHCICDVPFNFNHVFDCQALRGYLFNTLYTLNDKPLSPLILENSEDWKLKQTFLTEIYKSPVGILI